MNLILEKPRFITHRHQTPAGELLIGAIGDDIVLCDWIRCRAHTSALTKICEASRLSPEESTAPVIEKTVAELDEFFAGRRRNFDIPVNPAGTPFQLRVWHALRKVEYGDTLSYLELTEVLGNRNMLRANSRAIASNPISILIPCHRIICDDGRISGYRGGIEAKRLLLEIEGAHLPGAKRTE